MIEAEAHREAMQEADSAVHPGITTEGKVLLQETPTAVSVLIAPKVEAHRKVEVHPEAEAQPEVEVHPEAEVHPEVEVRSKRIVAGSNKAELEVHQEKTAEDQQQVEALQETTEEARLLAVPGALQGTITAESLHSKVHRGTTKQGRLLVEVGAHQETTEVGL